jgi:predicted metal-binding membrane protein
LPDKRQSAGFIFASGVAFIVSAAATVYFCRSMCCETEMPGGWRMSMMWMRMPSQTWAASAASFLLMWLAMMVAMMLPSTMSMLLSYQRSLVDRGVVYVGVPVMLTTCGYFLVWLAIGGIVYAAGAAFASETVRSTEFSRSVPFLSGAALVIAGCFQFTPWKTESLRQCRCQQICALLQAGGIPRMAWRHGIRQGAYCAVCCAAPMMALLVLGTMNLGVMILVTAVITMEKLMPKPEFLVRISGIAALITGGVMIARALISIHSS